MKPYDNVSELEKVVAEYADAPYAVAVDSCTNALLLCLEYLGCEGKTIELPAYTYVGVAYSVLNAGGKCSFNPVKWEGAYIIDHSSWDKMIIDSARRFKKGMYDCNHGFLMCLSGHWWKHLKMGRGGFILTDDLYAADILRAMRYDGRTAGIRPQDDQFVTRGHHCYMLPEEAARGLMLMANMPDDNADIPADDYADLSQYPIFQEGYR